MPNKVQRLNGKRQDLYWNFGLDIWILAFGIFIVLMAV
jgi:hypothetical protein